MKQLVQYLPIFIFLVVPIYAQKTSLNPVKPSLAVTIAVLSVIFLLILIVFIYTKFCYATIPDILFIHNNVNNNMNITGSGLSGLEKSVVQTLPFFTFSSLKGSKKGLQCSVCLAEFKNSDVLRLLPICKHAFHVRCIDTWLESHSSCPLCRHKFHVDDFTNFDASNRIRYPQDLSSLSDNQNLHEIFVERDDENLIHENSRKFYHKIIIRDFVDRSRWSNVRSSDLLLLNAEMIDYSSSKRFSPAESISRSKLNTKLVRSVSDRADYTTSRELFVNNNYKMEESLLNGNRGKDEKMKRLWFSIARRTIQLFSGPQEKISKGNTIPSV